MLFLPALRRWQMAANLGLDNSIALPHPLTVVTTTTTTVFSHE
jgi:ABC-type nitrate/sulfonate/bicarbonate transport system permease component